MDADVIATLEAWGVAVRPPPGRRASLPAIPSLASEERLEASARRASVSGLGVGSDHRDDEAPSPAGVAADTAARALGSAADASAGSDLGGSGQTE